MHMNPSITVPNGPYKNVHGPYNGPERSLRKRRRPLGGAWAVPYGTAQAPPNDRLCFA